jgi:hypothetical protein
LNWGNGYARWITAKSTAAAATAAATGANVADADNNNNNNNIAVDPLLAAWEKQQRKGASLAILPSYYRDLLASVLCLISHTLPPFSILLFTLCIPPISSRHAIFRFHTPCHACTHTHTQKKGMLVF